MRKGRLVSESRRSDSAPLGRMRLDGDRMDLFIAERLKIETERGAREKVPRIVTLLL